MELMTDWKMYQALFCHAHAWGNMPSIVVTQKQKVLLMIGEGAEQHKEWMGKNLELFKASFGAQSWVYLEKSDFQKIFKSLTGASNLLVQSELFLLRLFEQQKGKKVVLKKNFIFAFLGFWRWFLPSQFGIYICVYRKDPLSSLIMTTHICHHLLLIFQRGILVQFYAPEISDALLMQRKEFIRSLSSYHFLPVTGVFVTEDNWKKWNGMTVSPWRSIFNALWSDSRQIIPLSFLRWFALMWAALFK